MAFSKPDIQISEKLPSNRMAAAKSLVMKIKPLVDELHRLGAWPTHCGPFSIFIVDELTTCSEPGFNENDDPVTGMITRWHRDRAAPMGRIRRRKANSMAISISVDFLDIGGAAHLVALGASEAEIIFQSLAHEIHHLDEAERLNSCGLEISALGVKLACGVRPELPHDCQAAVKQFAELHNDRALGLDVVLKKAGDIADECCADLTGLHWLRQASLPFFGDWTKYAKILVQFRLADFQENQNAYDIANDLSLVLALPDFPSLTGIQALTFESAINVAKASPKLDAGVLEMFNGLSLPLTMETLARSSQTGKRFIHRLFGK